MSDENRDESGQFTAVPEPKFGIEGVEAEAGYSKMPDPKAEEDWSFDNGDAEAAEIFAAISEPAPETVEVFYQNPDGSKMDPNLTVTPERAADDLMAYHGDREADMAALLGKEFAAQIDALRSERIKTAADAEHFGVPLPKAEKAAAVEGADAATHESDAFDGVEGLAEETKAALRQPQVREYLESYEREHSQVREAYINGLEQARVTSFAAIVELAPHLAGLPPAQFEQGLATLLQVDPPTGQRLMNVLGHKNQIDQALHQAHQHNAQLQQKQFQQYSREQDVKFYNSIGKSPDDPEVATTSRNIVKNLESLGLSRQQIVHEWTNNALMRSAVGQQVLYEWSEMKAAKAQAAKWTEKAARTVPPVQRPGTSRSPGETGSENIQSLDRALSKSGSLKDAERLLMARMKGR